MKNKIIKRDCIACGKNLDITLSKLGRYSGGNYFGKHKIPVGRGKYKKIRTSKILGSKVNVVRWIGKEKEVEYWECDKCIKV